MSMHTHLKSARLTGSNSTNNIVNRRYLFTHIDHVYTSDPHDAYTFNLKSARRTGSNSTNDTNMLQKLIFLKAKSARIAIDTTSQIGGIWPPRKLSNPFGKTEIMLFLCSIQSLGNKWKTTVNMSDIM